MTQPKFDIEGIDEHVSRDDEAKAAGRMVERDAIVKWLRAQGDYYNVSGQCADQIERGEHLK